MTKNGVENFYFPNNRLLIQGLALKIVKDSVKLIAEIDKEDRCGIEKTNVYLVTMLAQLFQRKLIKKSIKESKGNDFDPKIFDLNIINSSYDGYLLNLKKGFRSKLKNTNDFEKIKLLLINLIKNDGFIRSKLEQVDFNKDIICTGNNPLAITYNKSFKKKLKLVKISEFFPGVDKDSIANNIDKRMKNFRLPNFYNEYINIFRAAFKENNIQLSTKELKDIERWHKEFLICIDFYETSLQRLKYLPNKLWTGSAGILWNKILATEIRKRGGKVTVFDHAYGSNLNTESTVPFFEFQETDEFVTFSDIFIEYFKDFSKDFIYDNRLPKLISIK